MERLTGLLLGAGASAEAGMPLASDLTAEIKAWLTPYKLRELNEGWRLKGGGYSDAVIKDLAAALVKPELHYEAILGHLETQFRRQRTAPQEYHGLYSWIVELVYMLLFYRQVNNGAFFERHLPLYDGLGALARGNAPLWIFSLNHDLIIEAMAARLGLPLYCGFGPETVTLPRRRGKGEKFGEIRAAVIRQRDLELGCMNFPNPLKPGIYLLKVHGSLDSFTFNDGRDVLRLLPEKPGAEGVYETLRAANTDLFYYAPGWPDGTGRARGINEIIYADDAGEMQFLRRSLLAGAYKFDARASQHLPKSVMKHFRQNLNFVSDLVAIGYSFGDAHINQAVREWIEISAERHLEIVAPGIAELPRDFLHVARQITLTNSGCTDYLDARAGIVRSEAEQLEKKVGALTRKLGVARSQQAMASFMAADRERIGQAFKAKLKSLPFKDGAPDVAALGDPVAVGRQLAIEMGIGRKETLGRILDHLAKVGEG
jgi:hypothetical protein